MIFRQTELAGCFHITPERIEDERGFFARVFCAEEFRAHGLSVAVTQCSVSYNERAYTMRGLHYQVEPHGEAKLVRCTRGRIFDVVVDLRLGSPTFGRWTAAELGGDDGAALYVPEGMAHGFLTLEPGAEVMYQISVPFRLDAARGIRWDDPSLAVNWPAAPAVISERDQRLPFFDDAPKFAPAQRA